MQSFSLIKKTLAITAFLLILFSSTTLGTTFVFAQTANNSTYTLLEPLPCIQTPNTPCPQGDGSLTNKVNLNEYLIYAINLLIALAAVAAVFMITWGGFQYMTTDSWQGSKEGKKKFTNAIIGLLMILCSYIILRTINPKLVEIPATLVPPLTAVNTKDSFSPNAFFDQISNELSALQLKSDEAARALGNTKSKVAELQAKQDDINNQLNLLRSEGYASEDPQFRQLETQMANITNDIKNAKSDLAIESTKAATAAAMLTLNSGGENGTFQLATFEQAEKTEKAVTLYYLNGLNNIQSLGNSPDKIQALNNIYFPAYGEIVLQENLLSKNTSEQKINEINGKMVNIMAKITDAQQKKDLQSKVDTVIKTLTTVKGREDARAEGATAAPVF